MGRNGVGILEEVSAQLNLQLTMARSILFSPKFGPNSITESKEFVND